MHRGHHGVDDAEVLVEDLGHRREAVGGAGGVRDDVVLGGVVGLVVDAQDDGDVLALGRSRDDDLLGAGVEVGLGLGGVGEDAGRLDDDLGAELLPGDHGGVALGRDLDLAAVDDDGALGVIDRAGVDAVDRVVLEEVSERLGVGQVVDADELQLGVLEADAQHLATDTTETVNPHFSGH
ncbi:hypothetical protein D3C86_1444220 [compost metagenome]